jgi:hypothetical protein
VVVGVLIVSAVALAVLALVAWPVVMHRSQDAPEDPEEVARWAIDEELQRSLEAIREIDMDYRAGNLSDDDFAALDRAERARAVELMRRGDD